MPLKIAVIGAGQPNIATNNHLPAIKACENVELVSLCDLNVQGVEEFAKQYDVGWTTNYDEILADDNVGAVLICTPDHLHAKQVVAAAVAGKHILCEKPVAMSMDELDKISVAVKAAGVIFMAGHMRIFTPQVQAFKSAIESGQIGKVIYGRCTVKGAFFPYPKGSPYYKKESRGQFLHNGPHYTDTLCYLLDAMPVRVNGITRSYYPNPDEAMETANYTSATIRFDNSAIGCIEQNLTLLNPRGYPYREQLEIIGTKATLRWDSHKDASVMTYTNGNLSYCDPGLAGRPANPFVRQIKHFAECVRENRQPITSLEKAAGGLSICLGALDSAETGRTVFL